jgi:hypothetical protein
MEHKNNEQKTKTEIIEERKKWNGFNRYILKRYGEIGADIIKSSEGLDELDILLAIKSAFHQSWCARSSKFDNEDKRHLTEGQSKELVILEKFD